MPINAKRPSTRTPVSARPATATITPSTKTTTPRNIVTAPTAAFVARTRPASASTLVISTTATPTAPKLTIPHSPKFLTDTRIKGPTVKSSEEAEVERIRLELEHERKVREENRKNLAKVLQSVSVEGLLPARSTMPLTVPTEFQFSTSVRAQQHQVPRQRLASVKFVDLSASTSANGIFLFGWDVMSQAVHTLTDSPTSGKSVSPRRSKYVLSPSWGVGGCSKLSHATRQSRSVVWATCCSSALQLFVCISTVADRRREHCRCRNCHRNGNLS
jgi:hypothetical protein